MGRLCLLCAFACLAPAAAGAAVRSADGSTKLPFKFDVPKPGTVTVAQFKLKAARKPRLVVTNKKALGASVTVVGTVAKKAAKMWTARLVIANRGAKSAAGVTQDFGFVAVNSTLPGRVTNRGVTGSGQSSFLNVTVFGGPNPPASVCTDLVGATVLAGETFGGYSAGQILEFGDDALCGKQEKGGSLFFGVLRGTSPGPFAFNGLDVAAGDVNGDGFTDIVATDPQGNLTLFTGLGDGTFGLPLTVLTTGAPTSVHAVDIDLDGLNDMEIAEANGKVEVFTGTFLALPAPRVIAPGVSNLVSVAFGRIDGDAFVDIFVATANGVEVFFGTQSGAFNPGPTIGLPGGDRPVDVIAGDFNNDGMDDLISLGTNGGSNFAISVALNRGSRTFGPATDDAFLGADPAVFTFARDSLLFSSNPPAVIVIASGGGRVFPIFGGASLGAQQFATVNEGAAGGALGDVNGDHFNDLLIANARAGTVSTFLGTSGGFTAPPIVLKAGTSPVGVVLADVNRDNFLDVIAVNAGSGSISGNVAVFKGNGSGTFGP